MSRPRKLALGLLVALAALALAEGTARLVYLGRWPDPFVFDPELGWAHRPGWSGEVRAGARAAFDARGLREGDREVGPRVRRRVLLVGDSVAFGFGLGQEETIARALERASGGTLEVLNAGVEGYGPEQATRLLARLAPELRPDVAVLVLCLRNDLGVPPLDPRAVARDLAPADDLAAALLERSALAYALARLRRRQAVAAWRADPPPDGPVAFLTPREVAALPEERRRAIFSELRARLTTFRDAARAAGAAPLVAVCPEVDLLSGAVAREVVLDPTLAAAREAGLPPLDLLPALREVTGALREKDGVHPTVEGAARIAAALAADAVVRGPP